MGLDMYLHKKKKGVNIDYENESYESWKERRVGYWRKANQIHKWFVDNVQDGNDDCGNYVVSKEQLIDLYKIVTRILKETKMTPDGNTHLEYEYDGELRKEVEKPDLVIDNPELCEELLPTQEGFFFGSQAYDEWYYEDMLNSYVILNNILSTIDFETEEIVYSSSW